VLIYQRLSILSTYFESGFTSLACCLIYASARSSLLPVSSFYECYCPLPRHQHGACYFQLCKSLGRGIDSHNVEKFYSTPISTAIYLCNIRNTTQTTTTTTTTTTAIINKARMKPARLQSHQRNSSPPVLLGLFAPWAMKKKQSCYFQERPLQWLQC
jgi:hypothetical protein